jgi:hypothetical protein
MSVSEWSATADENTTVDGINIAEHCPAKNINNAIRSVMAALKNKCDALDDTDNTLRRGAVIGEIRWFAMSTPPTGWLVCNGAAVGTSDYAALFAAIGKTFTPRLISTDPDVENPEYSDPTVFRLPNLMGKAPWGSTSVGTVLDAGLPNIIGFLGDGYGTSGSFTGSFWDVSGAFRGRDPGKRFYRNGDTNSSVMNIDFNASWSNPIYGKSSTVQPPALCLLPCIRYE